jgi:pimeloyl-ACP methyl ester carboxylesterase
MTRGYGSPIALMVIGLFLPSTSRAQQEVLGSWFGESAIPGGAFSLRVDIARSDSGISAVMDIPESALMRFPVPEARYSARSLVLSVPRKWGLAMFRDIGLAEDEQVIRFEGTSTGDSIYGTIRIAYANFPLTLHRYREAAIPYRREDVIFANGEVTLAGTLYLPSGRGPFPIVLFTHGSGDATRDAHTMEADHLARGGIAALVYDKRGAGGSRGANWRVATFDELASDAEAGVRMLHARRDIDARHIGLYGISQGTWLIGMVAERSRDVAFLIFVSGSGIPVWEQEVYRAGAMMRAAGFSAADIAEAQAYDRRVFDVSRTGLGWPALDSVTKALRARQAPWLEDYALEYASLLSARFWWMAAYHYDPTPVLEHLTIPVLGLFGEKDLSFPVTTVIERMRTDLHHAGNRDVTLTVFPGAEHQLMVPQLYQGRALRRIVAPDYIPTLIAWVRRRVSQRR